MSDDDLASDLMGGVPSIAAFLGLSERQTYHLLEKGKLPAFKIGDRKWQARKSTLRRHIENLEDPSSKVSDIRRRLEELTSGSARKAP